MDKCPKCGHREIKCEHIDCDNEAVYEAWFRVRDGFGIPTGLIQKRVVCESCAKLSIAGEKKNSSVT